MEASQAREGLGHACLVRVDGREDGAPQRVLTEHGLRRLEVRALGDGSRESADLVGEHVIEGRERVSAAEKEALGGVAVKGRGLGRGHGDRREAEEGVERPINPMCRYRRSHPLSRVGGIARRRVRVEEDSHDRLAADEHLHERYMSASRIAPGWMKPSRMAHAGRGRMFSGFGFLSASTEARNTEKEEPSETWSRTALIAMALPCS